MEKMVIVGNGSSMLDEELDEYINKLTDSIKQL